MTLIEPKELFIIFCGEDCLLHDAPIPGHDYCKVPADIASDYMRDVISRDAVISQTISLKNP